MSCNQPDVGASNERLSMGIFLFAPISSTAGSPSLYFSQPLLSGSLFASTVVLMGAELLLYIAKNIFCLESIPVLDVKNGQTVQMPLSELQEFLKLMAKGTDSTTNFNPLSNETNAIDRGFRTRQSPETPMVLAAYVSADFSNRLYSPYISLTVPILTFPGIRGALPLLIMGLIGTIFVRAVVPPEATGAKPFIRPEGTANTNNTINLSPNDLIEMLSRFGKHFGSK